jgi:hypothetical protein
MQNEAGDVLNGPLAQEKYINFPSHNSLPHIAVCNLYRI